LMSDLSDRVPTISRLRHAYEALGVGEFTDDAWKDLRDNGTAQAIDLYNEALQADLKATGVRNPVLKQVVLQGMDQVINDLTTSLKEVRQFRSIRHRDENIWLTPEFISIVDGGEIVVTEEDQERLKEAHCRTYLENEAEIQFYGILERAVEVYKDLAQFNVDMKRIWPAGFGFNVFDSFIFDKHTEPRISGEGVKRQVRWAKESQ
jgi:hypothetical protein